jgi:hypothetical protein
MNDLNKKPWQSKTIWANLIIAIAALFVPGAQEWGAQNMEMILMALTGLNVVLRLISKDKVSLS